MKPLIGIVVVALIATASGATRSEPPSGGQWTAVATFSDEFDGIAVDSGKWYPLNPKWTGRMPSRFSIENILLRDGKLVIRGSKVLPGDPWAAEGIQYKTGTLKSQRPIKYGYFEVKANIAKSAISSAFWLYDHNGSTSTEIDVFELCGVPSCSAIFHTNAHAHVKSSESAETRQLTFPGKLRTIDLLSDNTLTAALEWDEYRLIWYVNGKKIREMENLYWHEPLYVVLDSEVFLDWFGRPDESELPSEFSIDYIRVWKRAK